MENTLFTFEFKKLSLRPLVGELATEKQLTDLFKSV